MMTNSREVSEVVFTFMMIGNFIAMVFMFSVFFFTLNFILIKLKPSFVYGNGWKTEDVNMNLMARHRVLRVDMTLQITNLKDFLKLRLENIIGTFLS